MQRQPDPVVVAWLDRQPSESVWITAITVFEIQFGIELLAPALHRILKPSMPCLAGTLQHPKLYYTVRPTFSALILVLILAVEGLAHFVPPAPLTVCLQNDWRFVGVRAALGTPEIVSERILETQDFREYAYSGGSIRFYVARDSDDVVALVIEGNARTPEVKGLGAAAGYVAVQLPARTIIMPVRPVSDSDFAWVRDARWTERDLVQRLGPPGNRWHLHGVGRFGITWVAAGIEVISIDGPIGAETRYQLRDPRVPRVEKLPELADLVGLDYRALQTTVRAHFARYIQRAREMVERALASGVVSPDGRFTAAGVAIGDTYNTAETVVRERNHAERRYPLPWFSGPEDYRWIDTQTLAVRVRDPVETVEFQVLNVVTGTMRVTTVPPRADGSCAVADWGVSEAGIWWTAADGTRHEIPARSDDRLQ
jgi:hypothetical protein